jgi:D-alanine-D-alanine ligase
LVTARCVYKALKKRGYKTIICEPDGRLIKKIKNFKPSVVFNALHGRFGEDGYIQAVLEAAKVKYTHSGVLASHIAMDKEISKKIFLKNKLLVPKYIKYKFDKKIDNKKLIFNIKKKLKFPVVIKPKNEGSSVDVYICNQKDFLQKLKKISQYKEILIEEYIGGREIQVAILGKKRLGAIELRPKRKFYDYEAKYSSKAATKHIIPVKLKNKDLNKVMNVALKAHNLIGCKGVTRSDFKFNKGKFYLLETNTQPGMTDLSLVPEIAAYKGMSFIELIEWIIKDASIKR